MNKMLNARGFTLIELVVVIVILGILAATAAPRFIDVSSSAKVATLESIAGTMKSSIKLVNMKARVKGLEITDSNPGNQAAYLIDFGNASAESIGETYALKVKLSLVTS